MPTPASQRALEGIRDLSTLEWYVIPLYVAAILVLSLRTNKAKTIAVASLYTVAVIANFICMGLLGWVY